MAATGGIEAGGATVEDRLVYQGKVFINFRTSRQWVSMKLFELPPTPMTAQCWRC
jgi:hypothetical protein